MRFIPLISVSVSMCYSSIMLHLVLSMLLNIYILLRLHQISPFEVLEKGGIEIQHKRIVWIQNDYCEYSPVENNYVLEQILRGIQKRMRQSFDDSSSVFPSCRKNISPTQSHAIFPFQNIMSIHIQCVWQLKTADDIDFSHSHSCRLENVHGQSGAREEKCFSIRKYSVYMQSSNLIPTAVIAQSRYFF